jgi:hypothetical protein
MTNLPHATLVSVAAALVCLATAVHGVSAQGPRLEVDADPQGNGPTQVGAATRCVSVASGDTLQVDIVIHDVQELLAWQIYVEYDPAIVEVTERDVRMFQGANPGSSVFDVSDSLPDSDGLYLMGGVDTADPPSPDSGSGVLARLTFAAIAPGISTASLARQDINDDGILDRAPLLRDVDTAPISDSDGDKFFDGPTENAQIAVDMPCPADNSGPTAETSSEDGGTRLLYILALTIAVAVVTGLAAILFLYRRRTGAEPQ